jgi:hypothetical protein
VDVPQALLNAIRLREELPMFAQRPIFVQIDDEAAWHADWGTLLPIKPSALTSKHSGPNWWERNSKNKYARARA